MKIAYRTLFGMAIPFWFWVDDATPNRYISFPFGVAVIAFVNLLLFFIHDQIEPVLWLTAGDGATAAVTRLFIHEQGWLLGVNLFFLWIFGRRVEDVCGAWRFLLLYLLCGIISDGVPSWLSGSETTAAATLGAQGAVYGIMGAYVLLFPTGRTRFHIHLWLPFTEDDFMSITDVPALLFAAVAFLTALPVGLELLAEVHPSAGALFNSHHQGALLVTCLAGALLVLLFVRADAFARFTHRVPL